MNDKELIQKLQKVWDDYHTAEIVMNRNDLLQLIELLIDLAEKTEDIKDEEAIVLQFLCLHQVNSAFISNIKTTRIHSFLKQSCFVPVENYYSLEVNEAHRITIDFGNKIEDIIRAVL